MDGLNRCGMERVHVVKWRACEESGKRKEDRGQRTEDRGQRTEDRGQRTEDRGQRTEESGESEGRGFVWCRYRGG
ncbi:uncharacterized protein EAF01_003761 [Botrytis porri]|uniref:uncharacterized protein n=1 Tax=Botrytis porri TaxID=87229 RepID=UPI0018FF406D|nr:uncharacterized protein EAF01_003761 [Botrytis porri]KAF7910043.1 hypothetical protein EAF01_003761 [Botrytis porri]